MSSTPSRHGGAGCEGAVVEPLDGAARPRLSAEEDKPDDGHSRRNRDQAYQEEPQDGWTRLCLPRFRRRFNDDSMLLSGHFLPFRGLVMPVSATHLEYGRFPLGCGRRG